MHSFDLEGKVAVVTGGGQGIGEGIAKAFALSGAAVVVAARHTDRITRVADEITAAGGRALAVTTDVTDRSAVTALADAAVKAFGGLHVWVNNAGGSAVRTPLRELDEADWEACLRVNLTAVWMASVIAAERMSEGGSIINVTSPAATRAVPGSGHYSAAKAGVNALTLTMSVELAPEVRVNGIAPGFVPTEVMMTALQMDEPALEKMAEKRIPLKRLGTPDDMAAAAIYLASDAGGWVTGQILTVSGGL
ncbi:MAG: glucose 1-dehydrogenase [Gammaproteobacteria bacterium]|nr:glucose 1-dehydrogenase [Gammaproteobacteria bacterium]